MREKGFALSVTYIINIRALFVNSRSSAHGEQKSPPLPESRLLPLFVFKNSKSKRAAQKATVRSDFL
jgi:hypothetical protein